MEKKKIKEKVGYFKRPIYTFILIREFSSFIIALYGIYFLIKLYYFDFNLTSMYQYLFSGPLEVALSIVFLTFALIHGITWFSLLPKAQPIKVGSKTLNSSEMVVVWLLLSIILFFIVYYIWLY